jgi:hypothetical protein
MDRGKAVGSVLGIALGIATMPILGPFCAFSAMLGAWAGKKAVDSISERASSSRNANMREDRSNRIRNLIDYSTFTNREYTIPSLVNRNIQRSNQNPTDILRDLVQRQLNIPPLFQPTNIEHRSEANPSTRQQTGGQGIVVDEYGRIFDPSDDEDI